MKAMEDEVLDVMADIASRDGVDQLIAVTRTEDGGIHPSGVGNEMQLVALLEIAKIRLLDRIMGSSNDDE